MLYSAAAALAAFLVAPSPVPAPTAVCAPTVNDVFYVDAVLGDDTNDGRSPATAFRTITRATVEIQSPFSQILVAPGLYDSLLGEVFPIELRDAVQVFGPDPSGGGAARVVPGSGVDAFRVPATNSLSRIQSFTVEDARRAFLLDAPCDLRQLVVRGSDVAFSLEGDRSIPTLISGGRVVDCTVGVLVDARSLTRVSGTVIEETRVGVRYLPAGSSRVVLDSTTLSRCTTGVQVVATGAAADLRIARSSIVDCTAGLDVDAGTQVVPNVELDRTTLAGNAVAVTLRAPLSPSSTFVRSIVAGNGIGFAAGLAAPPISDSIVDDGSATGPGVLAVDPRFVDPSTGDYGLRRTSPALDRTTTPMQTEAFAPDGNLDAIGGSDWGAHERLTMTALTGAPIGATVTFEAEGEPGGFGIGLLDRTPFSGAPSLTPYGALLLTAPDVERSALLSFPAQGARTTWSVTIPNDPALVGTVWVAQALVRSAGSPSAAAFTNDVGFRIE